MARPVAHDLQHLARAELQRQQVRVVQQRRDLLLAQRQLLQFRLCAGNNVNNTRNGSCAKTAHVMMRNVVFQRLDERRHLRAHLVHLAHLARELGALQGGCEPTKRRKLHFCRPQRTFSRE